MILRCTKIKPALVLWFYRAILLESCSPVSEADVSQREPPPLLPTLSPALSMLAELGYQHVLRSPRRSRYAHTTLFWQRS